MSINFKVIGLTRPEFKDVRSGLEPVTFGFLDLPEQEGDALALTHSATLTGYLSIFNRAEAEVIMRAVQTFVTVCPMVGRFREVLLYMQTLHIL